MAQWDLEVLWAAGFFEGEGSITRHGRRFAMQIKNTDHEPLARFRHAVEAGEIYGPYHYDDERYRHVKRFWLWVAASGAGFATLRLLAPHLSRRRLDQALDVLPLVNGTFAADADRTYAWIRELRRHREGA